MPALAVQTEKDLQNNAGFKTTEEILAIAHAEYPTNCASTVFSNALYEHANEVSEYTEENKVRSWAKQIMESPDVLEQILQCDEIKNLADDTTINFTPIVYKFGDYDDARTITINYSTQPKVLKQKLILANKPSTPNGDANPKLMDPNDPAKYLNTEPAWYGIMVVQHDSLKDFVGADKNNTLSVKYLDEHIDDIYPKGYHCTSKSALANDSDTINKVMHQVVDMEKDTNDYYVAGDVNLQWISYAEIAAEIIITIVTYGAGEAALVGAKGAQATKTAKNLSKEVKALSKLDDVQDYIKTAHKISKYTDDIADLEKAAKAAKKADNAVDAAKKADQIKDLKQELKNATKEAEQMVKTSKNVKKYKEAADTFTEVMKYRRALRAFKRPQTGNILVRNLKKLKAAGKTLKASNNGAKMLKKAGRVARSGMSSRSAKIGDWLFDATLKHGARLGRFTRDVGLVYGAITFLGDMYDYTSTTSKEFSNGIEFKPLCLLSADDLEGHENEVNYGMWLMWEGNSTDSADDDAAYLQAMDFASKFYYQLDEYQDEHGAECNVDIYVVRPIIRLDETNTTDPKGELFYLFMNEIPWSTAEQFGEQIPDVKDWERNQQKLESEDPNGKYKKAESDQPVENNIDNKDETLPEEPVQDQTQPTEDESLPEQETPIE